MALLWYFVVARTVANPCDCRVWADMSVLVVYLTFGEVYDAPQRAPPVLRSSPATEGGRSQPGLRPEPKKDVPQRKRRAQRKEKRKAVAIASL